MMDELEWIKQWILKNVIQLQNMYLSVLLGVWKYLFGHFPHYFSTLLHFQVVF